MLTQERVSGPDMLRTSGPPVLDSVPKENPQRVVLFWECCTLGEVVITDEGLDGADGITKLLRE